MDTPHRSSTSDSARSPEQRRSRRWAWICGGAWLVSLSASYALIDNDTFEGIYRSMWPENLFVVLFLVALGTTLLWASAARAAARASEAAEGGVPRRHFLGLLARTFGVGAVGSAGVAGAVVARNASWLVTGRAVGGQVPTESASSDPSWQGARIQSYRRLGRTDVRVSDISLGSARIHPDMQGEALARAALDRGVNYFDTAPDYSATGSENELGRAMKGRRQDVFLATKFCTPTGHLDTGTPVREYMRVVEESLGRLQTDYVDLIHIHSCDSVERLLDPNVHEAFDRLKEQGKVRFLGVSTHTPRLEAVASAAIESDRFDVLMLAYHFGAWATLGDIIDRAAAKDIGVVAMKTLKGAYHEGLLELTQKERRSYPQAAFRWVLSNPSVSALVISFDKPQHLDEYLAASGQAPQEQDVALLEKYDRLIAGTHCVPHCGECLDACPAGLPIDDVLRYRMYYASYGDQKEAMRLYSKLERKADLCIGCPAPCAGTCPHGVAIPDMMRQAHRLLS